MCALNLCVHAWGGGDNNYFWKHFNIFFFPAEVFVMATPFILVPQNPVLAQENSTMEFTWEIENCGWETRILTEEYTLYPIFDPTQAPIKNNTDYNVSITCEESAMNMYVTLSITYNRNLLQHNIEYIICKVFMTMDSETMYESRVNITISAPPLEITMNATLTTIMITESTMLMGEPATNSGYEFSIHFSAPFYGIITVFFALLFH